MRDCIGEEKIQIARTGRIVIPGKGKFKKGDDGNDGDGSNG